MDNGADKGADQGENAEPEATKSLAGESVRSPRETPQTQTGDGAPPPVEDAEEALANDLPLVAAPQLDADEATATPDGGAINEAPSEPAGETAAGAPQARLLRFALLAATIALVAGVGSFLGSLAASGIVRLFPANGAISATADARDVVRALQAQLAELSVLKASLDGATRSANTQFAKIAERLDGLEHAQADPAAKLARIADAVDRLDKRAAAAPETTGSIAASPPPATAPAAAAAEPNLIDHILDGWIVRDVQNGRALVESRYGGLFLVGSGNVLPGLGRVLAVKRQDGRWVVVTARGLITAAR